MGMSSEPLSPIAQALQQVTALKPGSSSAQEQSKALQAALEALQGLQGTLTLSSASASDLEQLQTKAGELSLLPKDAQELVRQIQQLGTTLLPQLQVQNMVTDVGIIQNCFRKRSANQELLTCTLQRITENLKKNPALHIYIQEDMISLLQSLPSTLAVQTFQQALEQARKKAPHATKPAPKQDTRVRPPSAPAQPTLPEEVEVALGTLEDASIFSLPAKAASSLIQKRNATLSAALKTIIEQLRQNPKLVQDPRVQKIPYESLTESDPKVHELVEKCARIVQLAMLAEPGPTNTWNVKDGTIILQPGNAQEPHDAKARRYCQVLQQAMEVSRAPSLTKDDVPLQQQAFTNLQQRLRHLSSSVTEYLDAQRQQLPLLDRALTILLQPPSKP